MSRSSLLHGYDVPQEGPATRLDMVSAQGSPKDGCYRWIHLDLDDEGAISWLARYAELPAQVASALASSHPRPHAKEIGRGVVLVLRAINTNPGAEPDDMVALLLWIEAHRVLTLRREPLAGLREVEQELEAGRAPASPAALVATLAEQLQARIDDVIGELEDRMDALEAAAALGDLDDTRIGELAELRRDAVSIRRHLAPQGHALADLLTVSSTELGFAKEHLLRELAERTQRHVDVLDSIRERAGVTQEEQSHRLAQRLNQRIYALTVVAGIFLPLSFVTGLLGVNVAGIPFSDHPLAFIAVTAAMVGVLGLEVLLFRKMGWL